MRIKEKTSICVIHAGLSQQLIGVLEAWPKGPGIEEVVRFNWKGLYGGRVLQDCWCDVLLL